MQRPEQKYEQLKKKLEDLKGVLVAFSGGVDSALLLHASVEALGSRVLAVTVKGDIHTGSMGAETASLAKTLGANHRIVDVRFLEQDDFRRNTGERCYLCKKEMFTRMLQMARERGLPALVEGSNLSDNNDQRPGMKAALELGVHSPLREVGLAKGEIRLLSRKFKIPVWDKPSDTCLCTRIPFGVQIDKEKIRRVNLAEKILAEMGFSSIRVRSYGLVAGIEVDPKQVDSLVTGTVKDKVTARFKKIGFEKVCVNLEGYQSSRIHNPVG